MAEGNVPLKDGLPWKAITVLGSLIFAVVPYVVTIESRLAEVKTTLTFLKEAARTQFDRNNTSETKFLIPNDWRHPHIEFRNQLEDVFPRQRYDIKPLGDPSSPEGFSVEKKP